jgi:MOSC domain-containing protein YiiM
MTGRVEAIRIAPSSGAPMETVWRVEAHAGAGLAGDRYQLGTGHDAGKPARGSGLTLIAAEVIDQVNKENPGLNLTVAETRRNVAVRGVDLETLIGKEFRVGRLRCLGVRRADPCAYLEALLAKPVLATLAGRAGLHADILEDGEIAVGDEVVAL